MVHGAQYFSGKGVDNANAFPLVIGAHDHEPYEEVPYVLRLCYAVSGTNSLYCRCYGLSCTVSCPSPVASPLPTSGAVGLPHSGADRKVLRIYQDVGGAKILKTGSDAVNVGICDIVWPNPKVSQQASQLDVAQRT